jgi:predicted small secreted protein
LERAANIHLSSSEHVFDEMASRVRDNIVAKSLLNVDLSTYLNFDPDRMEEVERRLKVLRREISPNTYALKCMELISLAVLDAKKKKNIDFLAREFVTTLMNIGVSSEHINKVVKKIFFQNEPVKDSDILAEFFREVFPHSHTFIVVFRLGLSLNALKSEILDRFDMRLVDKYSDIISEGGKVNWPHKASRKDKKFIVLEEIKAPDAFSAVRRARGKIARIHDLFGIFHHKQSYEIDDSALVEMKCCQGEFRVVPSFVNNMEFISDDHPDKAALKLDKMMRHLRLPSGPDRSKFFRVIDFHGMSANSDIVENQLLNLWTALETLIPSKRNSTKISGVVDGLLPPLSILYVRRLFKTLTFDLLRWDRRTLTSIFSQLDFPDKADVVEKVFLLVCLPEYTKQKEDLFSRLKDFELLRFRVFQLSEAFSEPPNALKAVQKHREKLSWQIHRIYRYRNGIIHSGDSPSGIDELVAGAHDYFDQVFNLCIELCSGSSGFHTFQEVFDFLKLREEQYRKELNSETELNLSNYRKIIWHQKIVPKKSDFFLDT